MNLPSAAACTGCGHSLGLEPIFEPDRLRCPDCKLHFQAFRGEAGLLRDCESCGGQFLGHSLLKALLEQREAYGTAAPRPPRFNPLDNPVRYLPCPVCEDVMMRRNFGRSSGVVVDVCTVHGTWFDAGELPRVLSFVEAGGLVYARKREVEEAQSRDRAARVRAVEKSLEPLSAPGSLNRFTNTRRSVELAEAGSALLDFVSGLVR
jgi:Zn-finger nucleic acid-binding protein